MEPTIYKPSIYKGAGIYKIGAGGGGNKPISYNLPENTYLIEYIESLAGSSSYFIFNSDLIINRNDNIYFKFALNLYSAINARYFTFFECTNAFGNSSRIALEMNGINDVWSFNCRHSRQVHFCETPANNLNIITINRTINKFETSFGSFNDNSQSGDAYSQYNLSRVLNPVQGSISRIYRFIVTDEDGNIKYDYYPLYNNATNQCLFWESISNTLFYPTSQSGKTPGPRIYF